MRIRLSCALAAVLLILTGCKQKASQRGSNNLERSSLSSIRRATEGDNTYPVVENTRFYADPRYWTQGDRSVDMVIQETIETQFNPQAECCSSKLRATGFINKSQRWSIEQPAHEGSLEGPLYKTTVRGCCAALTRYQYYDPLTGRKIYTATQDVIVMGDRSQDTDACYFVVDTLSEAGDDANVVKLQYGTQAGAAETKYLVVGNEAYVSRIGLTAIEGNKRTTLVQPDNSRSSSVLKYWNWDSNPGNSGESQHRFLELDLESFGKAFIPVQNGKLDLKATTLPPGASLRSAPPSGYKDLY